MNNNFSLWNDTCNGASISSSQLITLQMINGEFSSSYILCKSDVARNLVWKMVLIDILRLLLKMFKHHDIFRFTNVAQNKYGQRLRVLLQHF